LLKEGLKPLEALAKLQKEGIETRPFWNPMHVQPAFVQEKSALNGVAMGLFERGLCLPTGYNLMAKEAHQVMERLLN
jgi:dTDP-4-amino-4,6-dideoxygalactose transaminase